MAYDVNLHVLSADFNFSARPRSGGPNHLMDPAEMELLCLGSCLCTWVPNVELRQSQGVAGISPSRPIVGLLHLADRQRSGMCSYKRVDSPNIHAFDHIGSGCWVGSTASSNVLADVSRYPIQFEIVFLTCLFCTYNTTSSLKYETCEYLGFDGHIPFS